MDLPMWPLRDFFHVDYYQQSPMNLQTSVGVRKDIHVPLGETVTGRTGSNADAGSGSSYQ